MMSKHATCASVPSLPACLPCTVLVQGRQERLCGDNGRNEAMRGKTIRPWFVEIQGTWTTKRFKVSRKQSGTWKRR